MLNFKEIMESNDSKIEKVFVEEWKGEVGIKIMSGKERDSFETAILQSTDNKGNMKDSKNLRASLLVKTICNEQGDLVFSSQQINDLNKKSAKVLNELFDKAMEINGLTNSTNDKLKKN